MPCPVKRSHVHELLAAAFGHRSWAAFLSDSVLADSGVGAAPTGGLSDLIGRAVQLGYEQQAAARVREAVDQLDPAFSGGAAWLGHRVGQILPARWWGRVEVGWPRRCLPLTPLPFA